MFATCPVISRDKSADLALLTPPPELEPSGLALAGPDEEGRVGDFVWASGFPRGWKGSSPVVARGTIAGIESENWVNLDGTWRTSGGPLCQVDASRQVRVVGLLLGNASEPADLLRKVEGLVNEGLDSLEPIEKQVEQLRQQTDAAEKRLAKMPRLLGWAVRVSTAQDASKYAAELGSLLANVERGQYRLTRFLLRLLADHFRTGFLHFVDASAIRKLL
jgi:aryl carrier-like protein